MNTNLLAGHLAASAIERESRSQHFAPPAEWSTPPLSLAVPEKPRSRQERARERAAYHEAGHAVTAWGLGCVVLSVSIVPDDAADDAGRTTLSPSEGPTRLNGERAIVVLCAGAVAERRFSGLRRPLCGAAGDRRDARDLAERLEPTPALARSLVRHLATRAEYEVGLRWHAVEAVAAALLARATLSGEELATLCWDSGSISRRAHL